MERKSCCSSMNYGCQRTVVTPKKEDVKPEVPKKEAAEPAKGTCGTGMIKSPKTDGCQTTVVTPKNEDVKPEVPKKEAAEPAKGTCGTGMMKSPKTEEKVSVPVKKEESVKVNVGSGCCGFK